MSEDPSRKGFKNEDDAWQYAFSNMCSMCIKVRERALNGETTWEDGSDDWGEDGSEPPTLWPACSCEWQIASDDEFEPQELEDIKNYDGN
jgi:hypothetical protein